jgi:cyclase
LVKTVKFNKSTYIGDPINALRLFNEMEVDELILLDITASKQKRKPDCAVLEEIASEAFMPLCYGGGLSTLEDISAVFRAGFEKVSINAAAITHPRLLAEAAAKFGSQSVVASVDVKKSFFGAFKVYNHSKGKIHSQDLKSYIAALVMAGAGEILLNNVDRDGTMEGYDLDLLRTISQEVSVPLVACGGAGCLEDFPRALEAGAHACAAGSLFVYQSRRKGVLINYPGDARLSEVLGTAEPPGFS